MRLSILGVPYTLQYKFGDKDKGLTDDCDGYCDTSTKRIVVRDYTQAEREQPNRLQDLDAYKRKCMRHEIAHAFLYESGLSVDGADCSAWPTNEEMVDWIAIQGPKLYAAWQRAGCL